MHACASSNKFSISIFLPRLFYFYFYRTLVCNNFVIDLLLSSKWIFLFYIRKYSKSGEEWVIRITRLSNNSKFQNFKKRKLRNDILDESELWLDRCGIKTSIVSILTIFDRVNCEARWLESGKSIKVSCTCLSMGQKTRRIFFFFSYWILSCGKCAKFWDRKRTLPQRFWF